MYREQYGEYAYWCLGEEEEEEEEEDLYLFRVSHSDALSTAINRGLIKIKMVWTSQSCWNITSTGKPLEKLS